MSYWRERHPPVSSTTSPMRDHYDVIVVGAGLVGLVTAVQLAERGHRVVVLEAREIGVGTTGGSTAKVSLLQGQRLSQIAATQSHHALEQYLAGNRFGQEWLLDFCAEHHVPVQRASAVTYAPTTDDLPGAEQELLAGERVGLDVMWRDGDQVTFPFAGGVALANQAQLDPVELLAALADRARGLDVDVYVHTRVYSVGERPTDVLTARGTVHGDRIVLATGIPIADRGGFFARLAPERSYAIAVDVPDLPALDMYLSTGTPRKSIRTVPGEAGQKLLVGGNAHPVGAPVSEQAAYDELESWTAQHFPGGTVTHRWSAQDYHPIDALPYVGSLTPGSERILMATGFAKWGIAAGAAAATILADTLEEKSPEWAEAFASWHKHELAGASTGLKQNLKVGGEMVAGRAAAVKALPDSIPDGAGCVGRVDGQIVAASRIDGVTRQVSATCTHLGGIVRWNDAERTWDCPLHGSRFTADGETLEGPATTDLAAIEAKERGA